MPGALTRISAAVGTKNGLTLAPNRPADLRVITDLFDLIPVAKGGTAEIGGLWASERIALIAEVTSQIVIFQTSNRRPVIDGVIDPDGGTLKLMDQLATSPGRIVATVVPPPGAYEQECLSNTKVVAIASMPGVGKLLPSSVPASYSRRLVRVDGSSVKWFGVVLPERWSSSSLSATIPHIHFTPTPAQGNYYDPSYDAFSAWGQLWADYTDAIGAQLAGSQADQVLVIPFYKNVQAGNLGQFQINWKEVISAVVTSAVISMNPLALRDTFTFENIVSSSFSNGWVTHQNFNSEAVGAKGMTNWAFDVDGQAARPSSSTWFPARGVKYLNKQPPSKVNPVHGTHWYVGGRWAAFEPVIGGRDYSHHMCRNVLLFHGLSQYCT